MQDETVTLLPAMIEARDRFMELVDELRPELHRYCARMTGSVFDGEDVVQDSLAKAYYALGQMREPPNLKPWLFRIAHNTAVDFLKRYERKNVEPVSAVPDRAEPEDDRVDPALVEAALTTFIELPPVQRAAIILKDVLGHSLEEVATTMGTTVGAVKAALSRARANIAPRAVSASPQKVPALSTEERVYLQRYVDLFNDRDWTTLRKLLAEEAQLEQVSLVQRRVKDAGYFDRYAEILKSEDVRAELRFVDNVAAIAMFRPPSSDAAAYFVLLEWTDDRISRIRDFRYVPYIAVDAQSTPVP
ncbi:MAG TPA: sigma-70 family RNA polymerase sigma factor [Candidatus Eremiobacteraceae bacterium]|nr:sigma-70 family RNA polymerase sigma factor [Candidatus Eremiobacteraceae bacterium]